MTPEAKSRSARAIAVCVAAAALLATSCKEPEGGPPVPTGVPFAATHVSRTIEPRTPFIAMYPCSRCHAAHGETSPTAPLRAPAPTPRKLTEMHEVINLDHGPRAKWCYDCHTEDTIDELHLPSGARISFDEAYKLCGSCHGDKLADFHADLHGLSTGFWNGAQSQRSCTACHDPHAPKFAAMKPQPPPNRPRGEHAIQRVETRSEPHHE